MQAIGLGLLVLASFSTIVYLTTADRARDVDSAPTQVVLSLSIGVLSAVIALILQIDLIPDDWDLAVLLAGACAMVLVAIWRYLFAR